MEKIVATISSFASNEEYTSLSETVKDIDSHVDHLHQSLVTFISDHYAYHEDKRSKYNEEFDLLRRNMHRLKISLRWAIGGLLCSGIAILALCIHLLS